MQSSEVQIHTEAVAQPYHSVGIVEAKRSKRNAFSPDPTVGDVNSELRQKAANMGANAVLNVTYTRNMTMMCYGVLTARGEAVILESDIKVCPFCAELINSVALRCRYCSAAV